MRTRLIHQPATPLWRPRSGRALLSLLRTDIVDSTRLAVHLGDAAWGDVMDCHDAIAMRSIRACRGTAVGHLGDGVLAAFTNTHDALECWHTMVRACRPTGLELRAGLHHDECDVRRGDVSGVAVHALARVTALAAEGELLLTEAATATLSGAERLRERPGIQLRGLPGTWRLFAISDVELRRVCAPLSS